MPSSQPLTANEQTRSKQATKLIEAADNIESLIARQTPDISLSQSYVKCFGGSEFFDPDIFDQVLRARSLVDEMACSDAEAAELLLVAVLASLIPGSRLIQRGDVRSQKRPPNC